VKQKLPLDPSPMNNPLGIRKEASEMKKSLIVGVIGDYDPNLRFHIATNEALNHAAKALSVPLDCSWLPTQSLAPMTIGKALKQFDALWCGPGSPYKSMDGALLAIRFAREQGWPFIGT
jgi:CTP synthase (UTP-ammonia lyase)